MKLRQLIESFVISNDEFEDYLDRATEQLVTEIQSGKNARDAVHDLSVQFSKMHNSAYAAYTRMSDSLFARLHTLELEGSESSDMMGGDMSPEMLNDPMGSGMEMDVPPAEDMPMDSEMDDYNAVMANEPEVEEGVQERSKKNLDEGWCAICGDEPCSCDGAVNEVDMGQAKSVQDRKDSAGKKSGKYNVVNGKGKVVSSHDNQGDAIRAASDSEDYKVKKVEEGWETMKPIDKEKYQERPGLEGPFQTRVGKVVYYDPKEGAYYDPDSDMYMSYEEWKELDGNSPLRNEAEEQFAGWLAFYNGKKLAIRKHQAKDIYNAKLKAIKHFNVPKSKQGLLAIKPAYEELNEAKQLNELLPLLAPAAMALAPHLAGAAARAVGGALIRRGATALAQRGAAALAKRGATGAARAVNTAVKGAKAASRANTANKVAGAAKTAANIIGSLGKGASSGATSGGKDYSTLAPSLSKLNNSKYDKNKK